MDKIMILDEIQNNVTKNKVYDIERRTRENGNCIYYFNNDIEKETYCFYDREEDDFPEGRFKVFNCKRELLDFLLDNVDGFDDYITDMVLCLNDTFKINS